MKKKMRGVVDPFTLGLLVALLGSITAATLPDSNKSVAVQSADSSQLPDKTIVVFNNDTDG